MSAIQVISDSTQSYETLGNTYRLIELATEKHSLVIQFVSGNQNYVTVIVNNASHRAWKKFGKDFPTVEDAINNYKTAAIRQIIEFAATL